MIRPDLLRNVLNALHSHTHLLQEDFITQEYAEREAIPGSPVGIEIVYRYDTTLFFRFIIPTERTNLPERTKAEYRYRCTVRPGYESVEEEMSVAGRVKLMYELKEWLRRLYEDMVSLPFARQLQEHARDIDQLKERLRVLPDEPMPRTDIEACREELEKLKTQISEQLKKEFTDTQQLETRVGELARDIDFLKQTLDSMTKRQWGEALLSRLRRWKSQITLRQITAGTKALKLLMPSETVDVLDSVTQEISDAAGLNQKE